MTYLRRALSRLTSCKVVWATAGEYWDADAGPSLACIGHVADLNLFYPQG